MRVLLVTLVPNSFKLSLVNGVTAKVDLVKRYLTYYIMDEKDEARPVDAEFPFEALKKYYKDQGNDVSVLALAPLSLSAYIKQPSEDVYHLRKDVENLVASYFKDSFDDIYVIPSNGTFKFTASGIPQYHNSNLGNIRFVAYKAVKDRINAFNPDLVVLDASNLYGPFSTTIYEAMELALIGTSFVMDKELAFLEYSAEPYDEYTVTARIYPSVVRRISPLDIAKYAFRITKIGREGDKSLDVRGRSLFNEILAAINGCSPLYLATRIAEMDLSQLYLDSSLESLIWDNARVIKGTELVIDYGVKLQLGAVIYSISRDAVDAIKRRLGNPPFEIERIKSINPLFTEECWSQFLKELERAFDLVELTGLEEVTLSQVREAFKAELGEVFDSIKESKWNEIVPSTSMRCDEIKWEDMGLIGRAVVLYKGRKVAYQEQCWKAIREAFRDSFGLSSD